VAIRQHKVLASGVGRFHAAVVVTPFLEGGIAEAARAAQFHKEEWLLASFPLLAITLAAFGAPASAADAHQHAAAAPTKLTLDHGKTWATDEPLRRDTSDVRTALVAKATAIQHRRRRHAGQVENHAGCRSSADGRRSEPVRPLLPASGVETHRLIRVASESWMAAPPIAHRQARRSAIPFILPTAVQFALHFRRDGRGLFAA
jgi:hypothetical protein